MTDFRKHAERVKLARLLHTSPESLDYLDPLDISTLQTLRFSCRRFLLEEHRGLFRRVATAVRIIPPSIASVIAQRILGPLLCARVAGEMETARLIDLCKHLPTSFLASVAVHLEADQTREVAAGMPLGSVLDISKEMVERGEYSLLGDLVGSLPLQLIEAMLRNIRNGEALLRIAFFVENTHRLNDILDVLPPDQLQSVIRAGADENTDLWPEALALISVVKPHWQRRLVSMAVDGDEETLISMVRGVVKHDLWAVTLPLMELMTENHRRRVINLPVVNDDAVLRRLLQAASQHGLWQSLLPLFPLMDTALCQRVATLSEELDDAVLPQLADAFRDYQQWPAALQLIEGMSPGRRQRMATLIADCPDSSLEKLSAAVNEQQQWPLFLPLVAAMPQAAIERLINLPLFQEERVLHAIVDSAHRHQLWPVVLPLSRFMPERDRHRLAMAVEGMDYAAVQRLSCSLNSAEQWLQALSLMTYMRPERRTTITLQVADQADSVLNRLLRALQDSNEWKPFLDLLASLPEDAQHQLIVRAGSLDAKLRARLLVFADQNKLSDMVLLRMAQMPEAELNPHRAVMHYLPAENLENLRYRCNELGLNTLLG